MFFTKALNSRENVKIVRERSLLAKKYKHDKVVEDMKLTFYVIKKCESEFT